MSRTKGAGGMKTIYLPKRYLAFVENYIENLSDYVKTKLDEDMADIVLLLEQKVKSLELEISQLKDKIKTAKEKERIHGQTDHKPQEE